MRILTWAKYSMQAGLPALVGIVVACSSDGSSGNAAGQGVGGEGGSGPWTGGPGAGGLGGPGAGGLGAPPPITCGGGTVEPPEMCDGANLGGQTCASATLNALPTGVLRCNPACAFDTSGCTGGGGGGAPGSGGGSGTGGGSGLAGSPGIGGAPTPIGGCGQSLPTLADYDQDGPFAPLLVENTGPNGQYTMYRPATLGASGFLHPPTTWGNGITTTPGYYDLLLRGIASNGFVVIASNSSNVTAQLMTAGLDWLIAQNGAPGDFQGKLDTKCLVTIGYSLGGGAAVGAGSHADVITTVSLHGVTGPAAGLHAPLMLLTSETDTFVTPAGFVTPTYNASSVQTFYGTLTAAGDPSNFGHIIPIGSAGVEHAPIIAWLRLWAYGDPDARRFFYGNDCVLCTPPWTNPQRKNWPP